MCLYMDNRKFFLLGLTSMMLAACSTDSGMIESVPTLRSRLMET